MAYLVRRMGLAFLPLALIPTLPPAAAGPPATEAKARTKPAVVPFELLASNHMVVRARINGTGPYRLIFDLGAPVTLLRPQAAEAAGVIKKGEARPFLFGTRGAETVGTLTAGGLTARDLRVVVTDHPALKVLAGATGKPLDGIIGFTLFARYKTTIDYPARRLTFEPVDFEQPDLFEELPARLAGPKVARRVVLAPAAVFGLTLGDPADGAGVAVSGVAPGSAADDAGVKPGDVLTSLDGRWTTSAADAADAASGVTPGRPVPAVVLRSGRSLTLSLTPRAGF